LLILSGIAVVVLGFLLRFKPAARRRRRRVDDGTRRGLGPVESSPPSARPSTTTAT
jgi:hypothetical protein